VAREAAIAASRPTGSSNIEKIAEMRHAAVTTRVSNGLESAGLLWLLLGVLMLVHAAVATAAGAGDATAVPDAQPDANARTAEQAAVAALRASLPNLDYQRARYQPLHFKPAIDAATDGECLVCHREVLDARVRAASPAGVRADRSSAWYQTLATYEGEQMNFHQRHLASAYARAVMNLKCNFCHQGNDPREEAPDFTVAAADMRSNNGQEPFTLRKMVNPSETCLRCHGSFPDPVRIMALPGAWPEARKLMESPEQPNGCLLCHAAFRTIRHRVSYLDAAAIEDLAKESSDVCYGCHGGREWYRNSYPFPRHAWPGMSPDVPEWARGRPSRSDPRYALEPREP